MRGRRLIPACLGALALLAAFASPALALKTYEEELVDGPGSFMKGKAKCDEGERVVSGGFSGGQGDFAMVNKAVKGKAWLVKGKFVSGGTVSANCSSRLEVKAESKTRPFEGERGKATAFCDNGRVAVAGGWQYSELLDNSPVFKSRPSFDRWQVAGFLGDEEEDVTLTSYVYCLGDAREVHQSTGAMAPTSNVISVAACPSGDELIGGGFETLPDPDFGNTTGPDPFVFASSRTARSKWTAEARNYSAVGGSLETFAVCLL